MNRPGDPRRFDCAPSRAWRRELCSSSPWYRQAPVVQFPGQKEQNPYDRDHHCIRQDHRDNRADACLFVVATREDDDQGGVGQRVGYPVSRRYDLGGDPTNGRKTRPLKPANVLVTALMPSTMLVIVLAPMPQAARIARKTSKIRTIRLFKTTRLTARPT